MLRTHLHLLIPRPSLTPPPTTDPPLPPASPLPLSPDVLPPSHTSHPSSLFLPPTPPLPPSPQQRHCGRICRACGGDKQLTSNSEVTSPSTPLPPHRSPFSRNRDAADIPAECEGGDEQPAAAAGVSPGWLAQQVVALLQQTQVHERCHAPLMRPYTRDECRHPSPTLHGPSMSS
ncbi:unnamed protein product [Closterium sp. NIES-54]